MTSYKDYIANLFIGKNVHFKCDCLLGLDLRGTVIFTELVGSEIIFMVKTKDGKNMKIGENTPGLKVEFL